MSIMYGTNFERGIIIDNCHLPVLSNLVGDLIYIEQKVLKYLTLKEKSIMITFLKHNQENQVCKDWDYIYIN